MRAHAGNVSRHRCDSTAPLAAPHTRKPQNPQCECVTVYRDLRPGSRYDDIYLEHISIEARGTRRDQDATRARVRAARCVLAFTGFVWRFGRTAPQRQIQVSMSILFRSPAYLRPRAPRTPLGSASDPGWLVDSGPGYFIGLSTEIGLQGWGWSRRERASPSRSPKEAAGPTPPYP